MKANKSLHYVASAAVFLLLGTGHLHAVLYDFNTTTQLADDFSKGTTAGSGTGSLTNVATGGLGDSGSLALPTAGGNDSFLYTTKDSFSATLPTFTVSTYFRAKPATLSGPALGLTIGAVDQSPTTTTNPGTAVSIPDAASANSFVLTLRNLGNGTGFESGLFFGLSKRNCG